VEPAPPLPAAVSPGEARRLLARAFKGAASEKVAVLHLDADRRLLALHEYQGSANSAEVPLRAIVAEALRLGTSFLVMAHNHPSGDADPSAEDLRVSRIVADTARNLDIRLVDHIIFAGKDVQSLRDRGLL
jgi:DNA repair protein RadC